MDEFATVGVPARQRQRADGTERVRDDLVWKDRCKRSMISSINRTDMSAVPVVVGAGRSGRNTHPFGAITVIGRYEPSFVPIEVSERNMMVSRATATVVCQWPLPPELDRCSALTSDIDGDVTAVDGDYYP